MTAKACKRCGAALDAGGGGRALQGMCTKCLLELGLEEDSHVVITGAYEAPAPPPSPEELQPLFPNHVIEEVLGQGGMGVVYRARQKGLDRPVALKVLPAKAGRDPAFAERFTREAKALASLNHPNVTNVYDFGKAGEHHFLAMELVDGVNLRQLLRTSKVTPKQALQIVEQICDALQYAHDEGVVHRDIKPENILIDRKGRLKITDFGLAKLLGKDDGPTGLTMAHQVMGTPHYMAPEQVEHPLEVDHRADIYSLGVVFYELLTGELPLGRFSPPSGKVQIDVKLDEVVLRALEKEPARRYQTASAVKTDVHGIREPGTGAPGGGGAAVRRRGAGSRVGWLVAAGVGGALLLFGLLAIGVLFLGSPNEGQAASEEEVGRTAAPNALEGVPLFDQASDRPAPSLAFVDAFGVDPAAFDAAVEAIHDAGQTYGELIDAHLKVERGDGDVTRVELAAFPDQRDALADDLQGRLSSILPAAASALIRDRDAIRVELLPQGAQPVEFTLRSAPGLDGGYAWTAAVAGEPAPDLARSMTPGTGRFWTRLFDELHRPLAPSVLPAVRLVLDELAAASGEGEEIVLEGLAADDRPRSPGSVEVKLDVVVRAGDSVRANEVLAAALERLWSVGARGEIGPTAVIPDGRGIHARGIRIEIDAPLAASPGPPPRDGTDLSLDVRLAARDAAVGDVEISTRKHARDALFEDRVYAAEAVAALEGALDWARRLEDLGTYSTVSELRLARRNEDEATFRVQAELTARGWR